MDPKVKNDFLVALRSGAYPQTTGALAEEHPTKGKCYCALGVLAHLAVQAGVVKETRLHIRPEDNPFYTFGIPGGFPYASSLVPEIQTWAGVDRDFCRKVEGFNDNRKWSFTEIADWVEANG